MTRTSLRTKGSKHEPICTACAKGRTIPGMVGKFVQDSDEEDLESLETSPKGPVRGFSGNNVSQVWINRSNDTSSSDPLKDKIEDIQNDVLQITAVKGIDNFATEDGDLAQDSVVLPVAKRRRLSNSSEATKGRFESTGLLLQHNIRLSCDHHDTCTCDPKGANYPACAISLATDEAHHIEQSGNLDSLGDGSSTIPYGSLTQQRLMDRAIADLDVQKKNSRVDNAENGENLAESNYLSLPSFNRFLPQENQEESTRSYGDSYPANVETTYKLLSPSISFLHKLSTGDKADSQPMLSPNRRKRYKTEPMLMQSGPRDDLDDEISFSAGILSAAVQRESRAISAKDTLRSKRERRGDIHEPDDINVHNNIAICGLDEQYELPREYYDPRSSRSRSSRIKVEDIDHPPSPEKSAKKQPKKNLSKYPNFIACDKTPIDDSDYQSCEHGDIRQETPQERSHVERMISSPCDPTMSSTQNAVQIILKQKLEVLAEMGFCSVNAEEALIRQNGHLNKAIQTLLDNTDAIAESQELPKRNSKRLRKGNQSTRSRETSDNSILKIKNHSEILDNKISSNGALKTAQVEIIKPKVGILRDNLYTKIDIVLQEAPHNDECDSTIEVNETSTGQSNVFQELEDGHANKSNKYKICARCVDNKVADDENNAGTKKKAIDEEQQRRRSSRGRPRKKAKENPDTVAVRKDSKVRADAFAVKEETTPKSRASTPLADLNNNISSTRGREDSYGNTTPKTPSSKNYIDNGSSPITVENSNQAPKQDKCRSSNHSPLSKSHVPFRVGLSRSARITPLLRSVKK